MGKVSIRIILAVAVIAVLACKGSNLSVDRYGGGGKNVPVVDHPVDQRQCNVPTPKNASIMGENWILNQTIGNMTKVQNLLVEDNQTTLTANCSNMGGSAQASVQVPSTFDGVKLYYQKAQSKIGGTPRTIQCTSSIDGTTSPYALKGNCLNITLNGQTHTFVRATALYY